MVTMLDKRYVIPRHNYFSKVALPALYTECRGELESDVPAVKHLTYEKSHLLLYLLYSSGLCLLRFFHDLTLSAQKDKIFARGQNQRLNPIFPHTAPVTATTSAIDLTHVPAKSRTVMVLDSNNGFAVGQHFTSPGRKWASVRSQQCI